MQNDENTQHMIKKLFKLAAEFIFDKRKQMRSGLALKENVRDKSYEK